MLAARVPVAARTRGVTVMSSQQPAPQVQPAVSRRSSVSALLALAALPLLMAGSAEARDAKEAARLAAERKAKLQATAKAMSESGKAQSAFATSRYQLPEEANTPNLRTLANDRLRKSD